jgi:gas vesicle protein
MRTGKFLNGLLMGVAVGALVGVLFAPDKGSKTRKKLRRQSDDLKEKLNSMVDDMTEKYEQAVDKSKKVKDAIS